MPEQINSPGYKITHVRSTGRALSTLVVLCISVLYMTQAMSTSSDDTRISRSISYSSTENLDKANKDIQLKQSAADIKQALVKQGFRSEKSGVSINMENTTYHYIDAITVYDATTDLISDFNHDGFYHRFSVSIDADTIYEQAYVYARLYLSYEGGPWNHYATSDAYHISGDSELDKFIIETELADGFPPGYYDIRIDLYDADYNGLLLSYGPYEDGSLSALPLEDSYYDEPLTGIIYPIETEVIVTGRGGMGWMILLLPVLIVATRRHIKSNRLI